MIVCAPDMTVEIAEKFSIQPCLIISLSRGNLDNPHHAKMWRITDIGLAAAKGGEFSLARYLTLIKRARAHWSIVPDVFGDFRATLAQWFRYAPIISRYAAPIFVAQEFYKPRVLDAVLDLRRMGLVDRVALPMRMHHDVSCSKEPRLCAERAERSLRTLCGVMGHIHLLGPGLRALRILRGTLTQCERQGTVISIDTAAYKRAPNNELKQQLGGRWMPRDSREAEIMLEAWLKQALA